MKGPARSLIVLGLATAAAAWQDAAAADRFVPADPHFVVADLRQVRPDADLQDLIFRWRANPASDASAVALGAAFLDRARKLRQPIFVGRAEAVLAAAAARRGASALALRLYAQTLQYRHDFAGAETLLAQVILAAPRDAQARLQRASLRLVRGDFSGARDDCSQAMAAAGLTQAIALACVAQVNAASDRLAEAQRLLKAYPVPSVGDSSIRAYWLAIRGELQDRANAPDRAIADYGAALALEPENDGYRATLADALIARGEHRAAGELLAVDRPGLALLVRSVACARGAERERLQAQALALLDLEKARGDASHRREAALLALDAGDTSKALAEAEANFQLQKELADVRVFARAAAAARDADAQRRLGAWLRGTGYRDAVTENILGIAPRG